MKAAPRARLALAKPAPLRYNTGRMMWRDVGPAILTPWAMPFWFPVFIVLLGWSFVWKGLALWRAARRGEVAWFVALLLVNTVGILEILYLYSFSQRPSASPGQRT